MHIVLGLLTSIVTILWLFHRLAEMGIDLGGLNPFYWRRRRAWRKLYEGDPIFATEDPMEVAALFIVAITKLDGDISLEEKQAVIGEFRNRFSLDEKEALQLFGSSSHLLGAPQVLRTQLDGLLERHKNRFTAEQAESFIAIMRTVATVDGPLTEEQSTLLADIGRKLNIAPVTRNAWGQKA